MVKMNYGRIKIKVKFEILFQKSFEIFRNADLKVIKSLLNDSSVIHQK